LARILLFGENQFDLMPSSTKKLGAENKDAKLRAYLLPVSPEFEKLEILRRELAKRPRKKRSRTRFLEK